MGDDTISLTVPSPVLWSADNPELYDLKVELIDKDGDIQDEVKRRFEIRSISMHPDAAGNTRAYMNGKELSFFGVLDQGF